MFKVLIAVDESLHAQHAIAAVARLAKDMPALEVSVVNVSEPVVMYGEMAPISYGELDLARKGVQSRLLDDMRALLSSLGLTLGSLQRGDGLPAQEIVRVAEALGVDQIVMGTHGRGAMGSLFMGSTAQSVVHLTKCPVLLVRSA